MAIAELLLGWKSLQDALPAYEEAEAMYSGEVEEIFASQKIKHELAVTGEHYKFNLIKTPVNVRVSRCEIDMIKVPDNEAATERITEIWQANDLAVYYPGVIRDCFEYGDSYVMVWPIDPETDGVDETEDDELVAAGVEFTTYNPKNCRILYDPENQRRKWFAIRRWCVPGPIPGTELWRVDLYFHGAIERWISLNGGSLEEEDGWAPYLEPDEDAKNWLLVHDFGLPWFHHRTAMPYGVPVHKDGYGTQNAVNKELITLLTTTDSQGFPQRYGLLDKDAVLDENNDDPQWLDEDDASSVTPAGLNLRGGQPSALRSGPGTMQTLAGMAEVGQFAAADPMVFQGPAEFFIRLMAQITNTPLHYFDPSGDVPSGESLKVAEAPLVKDIQWLQVLQAGPVREEWMYALKVVGIKVPTVEIQWAPVESATGLDDWQIASAKQAAGVPVDQTLMEAGYLPEQVQVWLDADAEANTLATRVALLAQIGTAVQAIGAGVALGVVSEPEAALAVSIVLGQVNQSGQGVDPA